MEITVLEGPKKYIGKKIDLGTPNKTGTINGKTFYMFSEPIKLGLPRPYGVIVVKVPEGDYYATCSAWEGRGRDIKLDSLEIHNNEEI